MNIVEIEFEKSAGVSKEIEYWKKERLSLLKAVEQAENSLAYIKEYMESTNGVEFQLRVASLPPMQKILDIGFGHGETSLYLAMQGHQVIALDPSPICCELLSALAKKFSLPIQVYQAAGEAIAKIPDSEFDVCLFTASLHHCDDPQLALNHCRDKLKSKGKILLINEPILKFYRSKRWYQHMLEFHPEKVGHYGGNEHIYYYQEYISLLENAGFSSIQDLLHSRLMQPRIVMIEDLTRKLNGLPYASEEKCCVKFFILLMIKKSLSVKYLSPILISTLKRLSLLPFSFVAQKNS